MESSTCWEITVYKHMAGFKREEKYVLRDQCLLPSTQSSRALIQIKNS